MINLDELDKAIISELPLDATISVPELSRRLKTIPQYCIVESRDLSKKELERYTIAINDNELWYTVKAISGLNIESKPSEGKL